MADRLVAVEPVYHPIVVNQTLGSRADRPESTCHRFVPGWDSRYTRGRRRHRPLSKRHFGLDRGIRILMIENYR